MAERYCAVSYASKGILPYRGLGPCIKRALEAWPRIDFLDDRDGCLFIAIVRRKAVKSSEIVSVKADGSLKSSEKILPLLRTEPDLSAKEIARKIGITPRAVEKQIAKLRKAGRLRRIGPPKGGIGKFYEIEPPGWPLDGHGYPRGVFREKV